MLEDTAHRNEHDSHAHKRAPLFVSQLAAGCPSLLKQKMLTKSPVTVFKSRSHNEKPLRRPSNSKKKKPENVLAVSPLTYKKRSTIWNCVPLVLDVWLNTECD